MRNNQKEASYLKKKKDEMLKENGITPLGSDPGLQ